MKGASLNPGKDDGADKGIDHETYPTPAENTEQPQQPDDQGRDGLFVDEQGQTDQGTDIQLEGKKQDVENNPPVNGAQHIEQKRDAHKDVSQQTGKERGGENFPAANFQGGSLHFILENSNTNFPDRHQGGKQIKRGRPAGQQALPDLDEEGYGSKDVR